MPLIHIRLASERIELIPASKLGPVWLQFVQVIRSHDGRISCNNEISAPSSRCGDLCKALRSMGFTLRGSQEALDLALSQGYKPTPAQQALPLERQANTPLERWAHAGLNVLMTFRGPGCGPSKFDRPGLGRFFVRLADGQGLTENEWRILCRRIYKYRGQVGEPPK
jgi:hypothetical protein